MKLLLLAFPRRFRDRYGPEVLELIEASDTPWRDAANLLASGASLRASRLARPRAVLFVAAVAGATAAMLLGCAAVGSAVTVGGCTVLGSASVIAASATAGSLLIAHRGAQRLAG